MGRKPHALIQQHFERGEKLPDNSNRYAQTCKACNTHFPRGRIESLQHHLLKKCKVISHEARQNAALQLNHLQLPEGSDQEVPLNGPTLALPIGTRNWTALETLAEVSRHFDMNEKHDDRSVNNKSAGGSRASEPPRSDRLELQEQYTLENPPVSYDRAQRDKKMHAPKVQRRESETSLQHPTFGHHMVESRSESPNLAMAAAAAARFQPSMVDPQLLGDDANTQNNLTPTSKSIGIEQALSEASAAFSENFMHQNVGEQHLTWPMVDGSGAHVYSEQQNIDHSIDGVDTPRAGNFSRNTLNAGALTTEFSAEYGNGQKAQKHKTRGRFNDTRRKEVQNVRKVGACIRCRMLKKPCSSEGSPCNTCAVVESARLWKMPCIRARMPDMFEMYSANLHYVLAFHNLNKTKSQTKFNPSPHQIEASHFPDTGVYATFDSLEGEIVSVENNIDPGLNGDFRANTLRMLDTENDEKLSSILETYTKRMSSIFFRKEHSKFMNITLTTAERLASENDDKMMHDALELWTVVHMLVDHEMTWIISQRVNIDAPEGQGPTIDRNTDNETYTTLTMQLSSAIEKKAAALCKEVLAELERNFFQRKGDTFKIFLVAIITLNCVEKSTWIFKSWEQDSFKSGWPLDKQPSVYIGQGESLTNIVDMLMRMRKEPLKTHTRRDNNILVTDFSPEAKLYFEQLQLKYDEVLSKQANHTFDPANSRCYELRFCSRLLLPAN